MNKYVEGYKWTRKNGMSWYDQTFGPYIKGFAPTVQDAEKDGPCGRGIHIAKTIAHAVSYGKFPGNLYRLRATAPVLGQDDTKWRVASAVVIEECEKPDWLSLTENFIESIASVQWFKPTKPPRKAWKHYKSWDAAWDAARDTAWAAARDTARAAARDTAWAAARAAAWDAAWDAQLQAQILICSGLKIDAKHRKHAKDRWDVWERGYGLLCDVQGVFYTYEKP